VVQVVATGSLFRAGILVNSGDALERLAKVDYVVFDKTGTLTEPEPAIFNIEEITPNDLAMAARLAKSSHHVLARAFGDVVENSTPIAGAQETAGEGVSVELDGILHRLGSRRFCSVADGTLTPDGVTELWYRSGNADPVAILFAQRLKNDAARTVRKLRNLGLSLAIVSGDRLEMVAETAGDLAIDEYKGGVMPQEKIAYIEELQSAGQNVLMVGDGLNDAAALQAANVSAAPASALDITQAAADIVILGNRLERLTVAIKTSRLARRLMLQNFGFAGVYNSIAIPLAVLGIVTPLLAALFMSGSSVVVTLNALRAQVKVQAHSNAKITQS
jgi:Cu2+-exporting ATPase